MNNVKRETADRIIKTLSQLIPAMTEQEKERFLSFGEGMVYAMDMRDAAETKAVEEKMRAAVTEAARQ